MNPLPTLSIVIPSHQRADLLLQCLQSVTCYAPPGTEIVVVDDGSHNALISQTAACFQGVRTLRLSTASGFCVAANRGIAAASHEIVELLNDDTVVTARWAEHALRHFENPKTAAVAPLVYKHEPHRQKLGLQPRIDSAGDDYDPGGFAKKRGTAQQMGPEFQHPRSVWGVSATAGFYRRAALLAAGALPESFQAYFEDVDLSFRLRRLGLEIVYEPHSIVWHHVSSSYGQKPTRRVLELQSRNEEWVFWRNMHKPITQVPRHGLVLAAKALRRMQEGTLSPWLTGRVRFLVEQCRLRQRGMKLLSARRGKAI